MAKSIGGMEKQRQVAAGMPVRELVGLFGDWVPLGDDFAAIRKRLFTPGCTFWLFLSQVLAGEGVCREAVLKFLAWRSLEEGAESSSLPSPSTGAYCQARQRLSLEHLQALHGRVAEGLQTLESEEKLWCGRVVKVVDGSGVSMPDTPENQARYPQSRGQKVGCGFPVMRIVAFFSLSGGLLLDVAKASLRISERALFRALWSILEAGDVVLADRGFCSYADYYLLGQGGVDCVMRNHQRRTVGRKLVKRLGKNDRLIYWLKMKPCPKGWTKEDWNAVPDKLLVREVSLTVDVPGFRTKKIEIATTLLDPKRYTRADLADLYARRWRVEIYLRDIKTSLGMDILRCKTPDMVEKELHMHFIAYNLIRGLIMEAAKVHGLSPARLSFKGSVAIARQWAPIMAFACSEEQSQAMHKDLLKTIARDPVPWRPGRTEPRAVKRRPKNYQRLTKPRSQFKECPHRNKYAIA